MNSPAADKDSAGKNTLKSVCPTKQNSDWSTRMATSLGIALVLGVVLLAVFASVSNAQLRPAQSSRVSTSVVLPGDYVAFKCGATALYMNGNLICHDQTSVRIDICAGQTWCSDTLKATADSGYKFSDYLSTGDATFQAPGYACYSGLPQSTYANPTLLCTTSPSGDQAGTVTVTSDVT